MRERAERLAQLPPSQLAAMKLIVNQAYENMGLHSTQLLGPVLDGFMRNTPEALRFVETAATQGVGAAITRARRRRSATTARRRRRGSPPATT